MNGLEFTHEKAEALTVFSFMINGVVENPVNILKYLEVWFFSSTPWKISKKCSKVSGSLSSLNGNAHGPMSNEWKVLASMV